VLYNQHMPEAAARLRFSRQSVAIALAIVAAVTGGGCNLLNDLTSPSSTTQTPTPTTSTETFSGAVGVQGTSRSTFTTTQAGTVNVTLATMSPGVAMGLGIGTPNGTTACTLTSSTSALAGSTPQLTVTEQPGSYCVSVYDVGNLTTVATFTVTVAHP
jgi:hypothetical protein